MGVDRVLSELRSEFALQPGTVGTFAYVAPEQQGWAAGSTARPVEQRAGLYTLDAALYELARGQPPLSFGEPALVHDHLARVPVPPVEVKPAVPGALSRIILHLLEKDLTRSATICSLRLVATTPREGRPRRSPSWAGPIPASDQASPTVPVSTATVPPTSSHGIQR